MSNTPSNDDDKLDNLEERLAAAKKDFDEEYNPKPVEDTHSEGASIGYEFLAYVVSGGILGYGFDHFLGTVPFGLMIFMVFGFVAGVYRANHRTKQQQENSGK